MEIKNVKCRVARRPRLFLFLDYSPESRKTTLEPEGDWDVILWSGRNGAGRYAKDRNI